MESSGAIGDDAELGALRVGHDYDRPLVVLVTLAGLAAAERHDAGGSRLEVVGKQVEMDPGLALLGSGTGWKFSIGRPSAAEVRRSQPGIGSWTSPPSRPAQNLPTRSISRQSTVISCRRNDTTNVIIESVAAAPNRFDPGNRPARRRSTTTTFGLGLDNP